MDGQAHQELGKYKVFERLGGGGMGDVFRARDRMLDREVALKILRPPRRLHGREQQRELLLRCLREARAAIRLEHPAIVRTYDADQQDGTFYLAMERIVGTSLAARLDAGPLPRRQAARIALQLAEGLAYAHAQGVVHRDLKPANVLLATDGTPHLIDFGAADPGPDAALDEHDVGFGTPSYMSPEQARGQRDRIGPSSDVYGLGAVLHAMLAGRPPFKAGSARATLQQVVRDAPPAIPGGDPALEAIWRRCMAKDPADRYGSAADVAAALRSVLERRPRRLALAAGVAALVALLGLVVALARRGDETDAVRASGGGAPATRPPAPKAPPDPVDAAQRSTLEAQRSVLLSTLRQHGAAYGPLHRRWSALAWPQDRALATRCRRVGKQLEATARTLNEAFASVQRLPLPATRDGVPGYQRRLAQLTDATADGARQLAQARRDVTQLARDLGRQATRDRAAATRRRDEAARQAAERRRLAQAAKAQQQALEARRKAAAAQAAAQAAARTRLFEDRLRPELLERLVRRESPQALRDWVAVQQAAHPELAARLAPYAADLQGVEQLDDVLARAFAGRVGRRVRHQGRIWTLEAVDAGRVRLRDGRIRAHVTLAQLAGRDVRGVLGEALEAQTDPARRTHLQRRILRWLLVVGPLRALPQAAAHLAAAPEPDRARLKALHADLSWLAGLSGGPGAKALIARTKPHVALLEDGGGDTRSENAVAAGLAWLAAHQAPAGGWRGPGFRACKHAECLPAGKLGGYDVGLTGLATLAFLAAGQTHLAGRHKAIVQRAVAWLMTSQQADGLLGPPRGRPIYNHALGTLALVEAYGMTRAATIGRAASRALTYLVEARTPRMGWRYHARCGDSDVSVTGWAIHALHSARIAGLTARGLDQALTESAAYLETVTDRSYGITGYSKRPPRGWQGPTSSRFQAPEIDVDTSSSHAGNHTPTAIAAGCRARVGIAADDPRQAKALEALAAMAPAWDTGLRGALSKIDFYYWHHASLAMFLAGGRRWTHWNNALRRALLPHQSKQGHAAGSWDPVGAWGFAGGRVYSTAINTLTLTVYYRYAR